MEYSFAQKFLFKGRANCSIYEFNFNPKYTQIEGKHIRTEIVDLLESNSQKGWICYEIKISKSDFHSKAIKSFVGNYNYYLMPEKLYKEVINEIPKEIGVYVYNNNLLKLVKKAKKQELVDGIDNQLSYGMIRSLARERDEKFSKVKTSSLQKLREYIEELNKEYEDLSKKYRILRNMKEKGEEIQELEIELDVLRDVKIRLQDILHK